MKRPLAGAGMAVAMVSAMLAANEASASAAPGQAGPRVVAGSTGVDTPAEARKVRDYWTPQRMSEAVPLTAELAASTSLSRGKPDKPAKPEKPEKPGGPAKPGVGGVSGDAWTGGGEVVTTTGKVFFVLNGGQYTCSASAVESANQSTVVTAGHCLHDGVGTFAEYWAFVPGYEDGVPDNPYGDWVATELHTTQAWAEGGDTDYDVGMAVVGEVGGRTLSETVGAQQIAFDRTPAFAHAFGYPSGKKYKGKELSYCSGVPSAEPARDTRALRLACDMTTGSSGGPWLQDFDATTGTGTQVAVTSFGYTDDKSGIYGPYFGEEAAALYAEASQP